MSTDRERVLELISSGKITAAEGQQLLDAMQTPRRRFSRLLLNPLEHMLIGWALGGSALLCIFGFLLSRWGVRFDGALDVHFSSGAISLRDAALDQLVAWPLTTSVLWGIAFAFSRQARWVDFLAAVGVARLPLVLAGGVVALLAPWLPATPEGRLSLVVPLLIAAATIPLLVWAIALSFTGYREASGLRGKRCVASFILALVAAEVLAKTVLSFS